MIYGLIFLGHAKANVDVQRNKLLGFAKKRNLEIDGFISYEDSPNFTDFLPGDTVICYAWNCLCKKRADLRVFIKYLLENNICLYSATSKYCVDKRADINTIRYAFELYEDIRFNFLSNKSRQAAAVGLQNGRPSGRRIGSKNSCHVLDGKTESVFKMYADGVSMNEIARRMSVSAPTIKRILVSNNKI